MKRLWLDLGDLGVFVQPSGPHEKWQDHGLGLLRTILHRAGLESDLRSLRMLSDWTELPGLLRGYDLLLMNVRSHAFGSAVRAAKIFKEVNPRGRVLAGGIHASVAPDEMLESPEFDWVCSGPGEGVIVDLARDPEAFPRAVAGRGDRSLADWPLIDRTLWPDPRQTNFPWPLEPPCGWGPGPVATVLTSRSCPWRCAFCNEAAYLPVMGRRPVEQVIEELNFLDERFGPLGSVVIHDSLFFQQPAWLEEWLEKYPRRARRIWPYWAAARPDLIRRRPELFRELIRETNWTTVSIGFESGSDRVLKILNKECTREDHDFAIDLLNRIGDTLEAEGKEAPRCWTNIILGVPGESREDAFETMRMLRRLKRAWPTIAYLAPYPGSALGYQLTAEGKSLLTRGNYHRFPGEPKIAGIDYTFYEDLRQGRFEAELNGKRPPGLWRRMVNRLAGKSPSDLKAGSAENSPKDNPSPSGISCSPGLEMGRVLPEGGRDRGSDKPPHHYYQFEMLNGKRKISYGPDPQAAYEVLRLRLTHPEMEQVRPDRYRRIAQRDLPRIVRELG